MTTMVFVALVTAVSLYLIVAPFFTEGGTLPGSIREMKALLAEKEAALREIKEIEFDYLTGKLSDEDYAHLLSVYKKRALSILQAIERREDDAMEDRLSLLRKEVLSDLQKLRGARDA